MDKTDINTRTSSEIILTVFLCIMCVISILGNLIVFAAILGSRKLRNVNSIFLFNLSICDICLTIVFMPIAVDVMVHRRWKYGQVSCQIIGFLINLFSVGSISTVTAVAMDRYLAIIHCLKYSSWTSWRYISIFMIIIWTVAIVSSVPALFGNWGVINYHTQHRLCITTWKYHPSYAIYMTSIMFVIPLSIMLFSYYKIIKVARLHARRIGDINSQISRNTFKSHGNIPSNGYIAFAFMDPINKLSMMGFPCVENCRIGVNVGFDFNTNGSSTSESRVTTSKLQREFKAMLRLLGLIAAFVVCWSLHIYKEIREAIDTYMNQETTLSDAFVLASMLLIALHATWDPFIYAIFSRRFRCIIINICSKLNGKKSTVTRIRDINQSLILSTIKSKHYGKRTQLDKLCSKATGFSKTGYVSRTTKSKDQTINTNSHVKTDGHVISNV